MTGRTRSIGLLACALLGGCAPSPGGLSVGLPAQLGAARGALNPNLEIVAVALVTEQQPAPARADFCDPAAVGTSFGAERRIALARQGDQFTGVVPDVPPGQAKWATVAYCARNTGTSATALLVVISVGISVRNGAGVADFSAFFRAPTEQGFERPHDPKLDADGDGLDNLDEYLLGTDPTAADSDGDTLPDGQDADPVNANCATTNPCVPSADHRLLVWRGGSFRAGAQEAAPWLELLQATNVRAWPWLADLDGQGTRALGEVVWTNEGAKLAFATLGAAAGDVLPVVGGPWTLALTSGSTSSSTAVDAPLVLRGPAGTGALFLVLWSDPMASRVRIPYRAEPQMSFTLARPAGLAGGGQGSVVRVPQADLVLKAPAPATRTDVVAGLKLQVQAMVLAGTGLSTDSTGTLSVIPGLTTAPGLTSQGGADAALALVVDPGSASPLHASITGRKVDGSEGPNQYAVFPPLPPNLAGRSFRVTTHLPSPYLDAPRRVVSPRNTPVNAVVHDGKTSLVMLADPKIAVYDQIGSAASTPRVTMLDLPRITGIPAADSTGYNGWLSVADVDHDGKAEAVLAPRVQGYATGGTSSTNLLWFELSAPGAGATPTIVTRQEIPTAGGFHRFLPAHLNGRQAAPDLIAYDSDSRATRLVRWTGSQYVDGVFPGAPAEPPWNGTRVAALDSDGDGTDEAVLAANVPGPFGEAKTVLLHYPTVAGLPSTPRQIALPDAWGRQRIDFQAGDIDGDGREDLLVWVRTEGPGTVPVVSLAGTPTGLALVPAAVDFGGAQGNPMLLHDANGDGCADVLFGGQMSYSSCRLSFLKATAAVGNTGAYPGGCEPADLDGRLGPDLACTVDTAGSDPLGLFFHDGYEPRMSAETLKVSLIAGRHDVRTEPPNLGNLRRGVGDAGIHAEGLFPGDSLVVDGAALEIASVPTALVSLLQAHLASTDTAPVPVAVDSAGRIYRLAIATSGESVNLAWEATPLPTLPCYRRGNDGGVIAEAAVLHVPFAADVDGDGRTELGTFAPPRLIVLHDGVATTTLVDGGSDLFPTSLLPTMEVRWVDVDGDAKPDLVVRAYTYSSEPNPARLVVWRGSTLWTAETPPKPVGWVLPGLWQPAPLIGLFSPGDALADFVWAAHDDAWNWGLAQRRGAADGSGPVPQGGRWTPMHAMPMGDARLLAADVDGDGRLDAVVPQARSEGGQGLQVMLNRSGGGP